LGVTQDSRALIRSARHLGSATTRTAQGDAYAAAVLAQNSAAVFFIDDKPDSFIFGMNPQPGGANLITGDTTHKIDLETDLGKGAFQLEVHLLTDSVTDWLPAGIDPDGSGDLLDELRIDVGGFAAAEFAGLGPDSPIQWNGKPATVVDVQAAVFINGMLAGSGPVGPEGQDNSNGLAATAVFGPAAGAGVDEIALFWVIQTENPNDCDGNGLDDAQEIAADPSLDCDDNGELDSCQIAATPSLDINMNGIIDGCELPEDCNNNNIPDIVEIAGNPSLDCNADGRLDACQIAETPLLDLNMNGIIDGCELLNACMGDITRNGIVNSADLAELLGSWGPCP
ncbi:MAG: hypothetical protein VYC34_00965, partial [Planctomycetota bacterium]|nr:hypothetical protein [Planctomycetota bacterium]